MPLIQILSGKMPLIQAVLGVDMSEKMGLEIRKVWESVKDFLRP